MKVCRNCQYQNTDDMRFCLQCGTPVQDVPIVVNLSDHPTETLRGGTPTNFGARPETETFAVNPPADFGTFNTLPTAPKKKSKVLPVLAGLAALIGLLGIAGIAGAYFVFKPGTTVNFTPTPSVSPTDDSGANPRVSPSVTPETSFTPPTEPTKKGSFTINANQGWQLSDIDVVASEEFRTNVTGMIDLNQIKTTVPPSGVKDQKTKSRRIYPEFPTGALLMRTRYADGNTSNTMAVASNGATGFWENFPNEIGKLEFCVNDNAPEKNSGQFVITKISTGIANSKQKKK